MSRSDILDYTGVGMPPFCEMTLRAVPNKTAPPDLQFTVLLDGFETPKNTFQLTRKAEIVPSAANYMYNDGELCACNVFLHCNFIAYF